MQRNNENQSAAPLVRFALYFMTNRPARTIAAVALAGTGALFLALHFWSGNGVQPAQAEFADSTTSDDPFEPIESPQGLNTQKVELGRKLFHDPRFSHNDQISCASCHNLRAGGADGHTRSTGVSATSDFNTPTVLNSGFNFSQFWDGHAATLEDQLDGPVKSPSELGSSWDEVVGKLKSSGEYTPAFLHIYSDDIDEDHIKDALAVFERSLATPNSRFDHYLRHENNALTRREIEGYQLFKSLGCSSCHQGVNLGGNMYQKFGVMAPYFEDRGHITKADQGRFNVTGDERDRHMFKVPTLRNVALTAPYFHDGEAATLQDAVRLMGKYQLGRKLSTEEIDLIVDFLKTLTGELDGRQL